MSLYRRYQCHFQDGCMSATDLLQQKPFQLMPTVSDTLSIRRVNNPDQRVSLFKIILPIRSQCLLSADVP